MINRTRRSPLAGDAFPLAGHKGIAHRRAPAKAACLFVFGLLVTASGITYADQPPHLSPARTAAAANLVDIRTLVPDMAEDIKYAGSDNFVGAPVDGYRAPKCFLLRPVAEALARVEHDLRARHLRLKIWDCYRPARAVAHFVRWAHDLGDQRTKAQHYPTLDKSKLLDGYIASVSGHSRGATVDLGMEQCAGRRLALHAAGHGHGLRLLRHPREYRQSRHHARCSTPTANVCLRPWRARDSRTIRWSGGTTRSRRSPRRIRFTTCQWSSSASSSLGKGFERSVHLAPTEPSPNPSPKGSGAQKLHVGGPSCDSSSSSPRSCCSARLMPATPRSTLTS